MNKRCLILVALFVAFCGGEAYSQDPGSEKTLLNSFLESNDEFDKGDSVGKVKFQGREYDAKVVLCRKIALVKDDAYVFVVQFSLPESTPENIYTRGTEVSAPDARLALLKDGHMNTTNIDARAALTVGKSLETGKFNGLDRLQLLLKASVVYALPGGGVVMADRIFLYDASKLELVYAGTESADLRTPYARGGAARQIRFATETPPPYPIEVTELGGRTEKFVVPWKDTKYAYEDLGPWDGSSGLVISKDVKPRGIDIEVKYPDGTPAKGVDYTATRAKLKYEIMSGLEREYMHGMTDQRGILHIETGVATSVSVTAPGFETAKRSWSELNAGAGPNTEPIVLEELGDRVDLCTSRYVQTLREPFESKSLGIVLCPTTKKRHWSFSEDVVASDIVISLERAIPPVSNVSRPGSVWRVYVSGQNGWEVQRAELGGKDPSLVETLTAPETGYQQAVELSIGNDFALFLRNEGLGTYGKMTNIDIASRVTSTLFVINVSLECAVQTSNVGNRSLRPNN